MGQNLAQFGISTFELVYARSFRLKFTFKGWWPLFLSYGSKSCLISNQHPSVVTHMQFHFAIHLRDSDIFLSLMGKLHPFFVISILKLVHANLGQNSCIKDSDIFKSYGSKSCLIRFQHLGFSILMQFQDFIRILGMMTFFFVLWVRILLIS